MDAASQHVDALNNIPDVVLQSEVALRCRYVSRVDPIHKIQVVLRHQRNKHVAQQCRKMSGKRRNEQHCGVALTGHSLKMNKAAKRSFEQNTLAYGGMVPSNDRCIKTKTWMARGNGGRGVLTGMPKIHGVTS